jgi:outer membrane protease
MLCGIGVTGGVTKEAVYENNALLSRLDWEDTVIPVLSLGCKLGFYGLIFSGDIFSGLPVRSGFAKDYDFLMPDSTAPTHYSEHKSYLDKYVEGTAKLGYSAAFNNFFMEISAGYLYRNKKWTARDGFLQYPAGGGSWSGEEEKFDVSGPLILYEMALRAVIIDACFGYTFFDSLIIAVNGSIYPIINADTVDDHVVRGIEFYDVLNEGIGWKLQLTLDYYPENNHVFSFFFLGNYEAIDIIGYTSSRQTGMAKDPLLIDSGYSSGMTSSQWSFSLGFRLKVWLNNHNFG